MNVNRWAFLQLCDSAFPSGGFVHSGGLEASVRFGAVRTRDDLHVFVEQALWQTALGSIPFLHEVHAGTIPSAVDARCDVFLLSPVARKASLAQGGALLLGATKIFGHAALVSYNDDVRARSHPGHLFPMLGLISHACDIARVDAASLALTSSVRSVLSAAVRLNLIGPYEAGRMQHELAETFEQALLASDGLRAEDATNVSPRIELVQAAHEALDVRLFQS